MARWKFVLEGPANFRRNHSAAKRKSELGEQLLHGVGFRCTVLGDRILQLRRRRRSALVDAADMIGISVAGHPPAVGELG